MIVSDKRDSIYPMAKNGSRQPDIDLIITVKHVSKFIMQIKRECILTDI